LDTGSNSGGELGARWGLDGAAMLGRQPAKITE
jgi:hypothetical protein